MWGFFNLSTIPRPVGIPLYWLGLSEPQQVYDLWEHQDCGQWEDNWQDELRQHACRLLRLTPVEGD